jgi:hypothetical protein
MKYIRVYADLPYVFDLHGDTINRVSKIEFMYIYIFYKQAKNQYFQKEINNQTKSGSYSKRIRVFSNSINSFVVEKQLYK